MSIKKFFLFSLLSLVFTSSIFSQILEPIKWSSNVNKISDTEYELVFSATIDKNWKLYSQEEPDGLGPLPTVFEFKDSDGNYELIGEVTEPKVEPYHDKVFDLDIKFFLDKAEFKQRIKLLNPDYRDIKASVDYMTCDDEKCIPADHIFNVSLGNDSSKQNSVFNKGNQLSDPVEWLSEVNKISDTEYELVYIADIEKGWHFYSQFTKDTTGLGPITTEFSFNATESNYELLGKTSQSETIETYEPAFNMDVNYFENKAIFKQRIKLLNPEIKIIEAGVYYQVCNSERCLAPSTFEIKTALNGEKIDTEVIVIDEKSKQLSEALNLNVTGWYKYEKEDVTEKSNLNIFFLGFLGGLIALLTPCVFPMIPLTVSFFTKSAGDSKKGVANSVMYGFFIFLIYFLLSLPFHILDSLDPEILNNISTNVTLNIIFFIIFIAFAFSFFGYFELTLPQSWSAALDSKANSIGGLIGVFFMALTLAIVSFSCTGPILGTLLGSSLTSDGGAMQLTMGMSGFGLALALPFTLFAMFPKWLNQLPKSGGWLNTVKVVLGFIEIALALKFLSNADLVKHWGLLKREVFIGLWIIIGIGLLLYLLGKIKFPHDGPKKKPTKWRWSFIFLVAAFVVYLIPGLTNTKHANLTLLSGFPPPLPYSIYEKDSECPLGLNCYKDLEDGIAAAKAENKPIMLDFTGWACVNCRKMEEQVWSKDKIYKMLNEDYVIISLYVDDRKELPTEEQFKFLKASGSVKDIETIGDKWATLQTMNFQNNSQPYYVLLNHDMELLNHTTAYTPDEEVYFEWLKKGLENFKETSIKTQD